MKINSKSMSFTYIKNPVCANKILRIIDIIEIVADNPPIINKKKPMNKSNSIFFFIFLGKNNNFSV